MLFKQIIPNRWLIWAIGIAVFTTIVLFGIINHAIIEIEEIGIESYYLNVRVLQKNPEAEMINVN